MSDEIRDDETIDNLLDRRFRDKENRLRKMVGSTASVEDFKKLCENEIGLLAYVVMSELAGKFRQLKEKLTSKEDKLADLKIQRQKDAEDLHNCKKHKDGKQASIYYWIIYLLLVGAAILVFAWRFKLIMPEQHGFIGVLQAIVMAAPSFLIAYLYEKCQDKDRFLKWLHIIGLTAAVLMALSAAISGASANFLMSNATSSSGSFLSGGGASSSSWLDMFQLISSTICFIAAIAVEITFAGRLMILINESRAAKKPIEELEGRIQETEHKISELEEESFDLTDKIGRIEPYENAIDCWRQSRLTELVISHTTAQDEAYGKAMKQLGERPFREILQFSNGIVKDKEESTRPRDRQTSNDDRVI